MNLSIFADGGETGGLLERLDWSNNPLGPVQAWPRSLKTCVRIILTSRQPMFVWWGPQLINLYNDAYRDIVGGKHPKALGQPASVVWHEIWDQVGPRAESTIRSNRGTYDEALLLIMNRHGYEEETYYTFSYSPVPDDDGTIGGIICANTDETQQMVDERRLAVLREVAARTSQSRTLQQACAASAEAIASEAKDLPFGIIYLSDADHPQDPLVCHSPLMQEVDRALRTSGLSPEDLSTIAGVMVSREIKVFAPMSSASLPTGAWPRPPHQLAAVPIQPSGETGRSGVLLVGLNPYRPYDDRYRDFLLLLAGQIGAAIANAQAYEEERKRAEILAELDRAKTVFFSNVSHEFRTPLTLMLGPVEDALADYLHPLSPRQRERLELIHRNAQRLLRLVNSLLDFSRIEAGRMKAAFRPVDLSVLTSDLASTFRSAIERAGLSFIIDCPPLEQPVYVDVDMWEKIVLNLLSNAFKHTFTGSITVSLRPVDSAVALSVADTGVGIAPDQLGHIFQRFHRVQGARSRTHEGTGIGLALVQELVKLHGGTIEVHSQVDVGSTFVATIRLGTAHLPREQIATRLEGGDAKHTATPYLEEARRWLPDANDGEDAPAGRSPTPKVGRILLADDNADMREYVQKLLSRHWQVEAVADGAAALEVARRNLPDLVLSDVMMPQLDGFGLLRELRRDERTLHVPVILLSARAGEDANIEGLAAGADDYLTKPFSAQELIARVAAHLQLKKQRDAAARLVREKERLLRIVTDHAHVGLIMVDREHRYLVANSTYGTFIQRDPQTIIGQRMSEVLGPIYEHHLRARIARALDGEPVQFEVRFPPGEVSPEERHFASFYARTEDDQAGPCVIAAILDITERKRVEEDLRESQRTLMLSLQSAQTAAWTWNATAMQLVSSVNLHAIYGLPPGSRPTVDDIRNLIHPDDVAERTAAVAHALAHRSPYHARYRLQHRNHQRWIWVEETGESYEEVGSTFLRGVTVDITARVEMEVELKKSEERFRSIVNQSLAGIAESDGSGLFTTVNDRYCDIAGYPREQLLTMTKRNLTHPDDRSRNDALMDRLAAEGTAFEIEKRYVRADGSSIWVHNSVSGVRNAEGKLNRIITICIDISDRKRIEVALRYRTEQYATLLNQAPIGAYVVDADFRISEMNPMARPAFAAFGDEVLGRDYAEVLRKIRPAAYAEELVAIFRRTLDTGEPHVVHESPRYPGVRNRHEWRIDRITMPDGRYGVVCYFRDITAQIEAREELARHAEDLRRANAELELFASIASHDLQEPLRMISSYSDILLRRYASDFDAQGKAYFNRIAGGADRMRSLIRALHSYAQVGKQQSAMVEVPLREVVAGALENLQEQLRQRSATIAVAELPIVNGDPARLLQLFQNLIANAVKFTPKQRQPEVSVDAIDEGDAWRIRIADNGIGIPEHARGRIFQVFQRLHSTEEYPGTGIGLATCKKIVEQHGGLIGFTSAVDRGSTFWFLLRKAAVRSVAS